MYKNDNNTLTETEMKEYIDHMYFLYDTDTDNIFSIICANRISYMDKAFNVFRPMIIATSRYNIKYFVTDPGVSKEDLSLLVREFLADMNDAPTIFETKEFSIEDNRYAALKENGFKYNSNLEFYIRTPSPSINYNMIH